MMVNGVRSVNPFGGGGGMGGQRPEQPGVAAKMSAQPWMQSGLGAQGYFNSLNPQQQYDAVTGGGKGSLHGALLNSGMAGDQINQFINGAAYHGGDIGQLNSQSPGTTFGSFNGAVNTGTGLQRGANFGNSMNTAFGGTPGDGSNPRSLFGSPGGFGPPPPSSGLGPQSGSGGGQSGNNFGSFNPGGQTPNGGSFNPYAPVQGGNPLPSWMPGSNSSQSGNNSSQNWYNANYPGGWNGMLQGQANSANQMMGQQPQLQSGQVMGPSVGAMQALQQLQQAQRAQPNMSNGGGFMNRGYAQ